MKQIGARQEAGRLGGIGSCGRELCCSTWLTDFRSVSTSAARYQQLSLNTQKLVSQCGKLKCCLNYELDSYLDALSKFPKNFNKLKTKKGIATHLKTDIFRGIMWYLYEEENGATTPVPLNKDRVAEILKMNREDEFPADLRAFAEIEEPREKETYGNVVGQDSLTRFDETKKKSKSRNKGRKKKSTRPAGSRPSAEAKNKSIKAGGKPKSQGAAAKGRRPKPKRGKSDNSNKGNAN